MNPVFVTGGTGYLGRALIEALLERGFTVHALARPESVHRLPPGRHFAYVSVAHPAPVMRAYIAV